MTAHVVMKICKHDGITIDYEVRKPFPDSEPRNKKLKSYTFACNYTACPSESSFFHASDIRRNETGSLYASVNHKARNPGRPFGHGYRHN